GPSRLRCKPASASCIGNLSLGLASNGVLVLPALIPLTAAYASEFTPIGLLDLVELPLGVRVLIAIVVLDGVAYAQHRLLHRVDVLWRLHLVHHSDLEIDATTTVRHHPAEAIFKCVLVGVVFLS